MPTIGGDRRRYYAALAAGDGETDHVEIHARLNSLSVTVHPGPGGSAEIETSCRPIADVEAGNASWVPVRVGDSTRISEPSGAALPPSVTAVRLKPAGAAAEAYLSGLV